MNAPAPLAAATPAAVRAACRDGSFGALTAGVAMGHVQANLVVLPAALAFDFLLFCQRNPKPCPVIEVTERGGTEPVATAPGADLRTDLPRYRLWRDGVMVEEPADVVDYWRDDFVAFLIGCSFTFEAAMLAAGLPLRHLEEGCCVPVYVTDRPCAAAGAISGPLVVSMRPLTPADAVRAVQVTGRYPRAHGAPIHIGAAEAIGITDLGRPEFGDAVSVRAGEVPVFWACGVTPQAAIMAIKPEVAITHAPGYMFVTDWRDEALAIG